MSVGSRLWLLSTKYTWYALPMFFLPLSGKFINSSPWSPEIGLEMELEDKGPPVDKGNSLSEESQVSHESQR